MGIKPQRLCAMSKTCTRTQKAEDIQTYIFILVMKNVVQFYIFELLYYKNGLTVEMPLLPYPVGLKMPNG